MSRRPFIRCGRHRDFFEALESRVLLDGTDDLLDSLNDDLTDTLSNLPVVDNSGDTGPTDSCGNTSCGDNGVSTDTCGTDTTDYTDYTPVVSAPVRPSGVRALRVSRTSIQLSWRQSDNNADGFTITRWGADGKHVVAHLTGDARSYVDGHLAAGRTYRYVIRAYNQGGQADSAAVSASTAGDHLTVMQQPHTVTAGQTFSIGVDMRSANNALETFAPARMTISISGGPKGSALGGTLTVAANAGVATFSGLSLTTAGTYSLSITDGLTVVSTRDFSVTADASSAHLVLLSQAKPGAMGKNLGLRFAVDDAFGNVVRSNSSVSLALTAGPGTLQGRLTAPVKNGVATFTRASLSAAGTYTLTATDGQLAGAGLSFTQQVGKAAVTVAVAKIPARGWTVGTSATMAVKLASIPAGLFTGEVTLVGSDGTVLATATVNAAGVAHFALALTPGKYTATIRYAGDANHAPAASHAFTFKMIAASTTGTLQTTATGARH